MNSFKVLIVEDVLEDAQNLSDILKRAPLRELTQGSFDRVATWIATNQASADQLVARDGPAEPEGFDLVLLDLRYPLVADGSISEEPDTEYQGMKWLPVLRRLQPQAAIVVVTSYALAHHFCDAVRAIRDYQADDVVPKNVPYQELIMRISVACENARRMNLLRRLQTEFRTLIHSRFARTYAQDVAGLLEQAKGAFFQLARRLEAGDPSAMLAAPDEIRAGFRSLKDKFGDLSALLYEGQDRRGRIELAAMLRDLVILYEDRFRQAKARVVAPVQAPKICVTTFPSDLKIAVHEVLANAAEALERSNTPSEQRCCQVVVEANAEGAVIRVSDNGGGIPASVIPRLFQLPVSPATTSIPRGTGLYIARRMMYSLGGSIQIQNHPEGIAEVILTLRDLEARP